MCTADRSRRVRRVARRRSVARCSVQPLCPGGSFGPSRQNQRRSFASRRFPCSAESSGKTRRAQSSVGHAQIVPRSRPSRRSRAIGLPPASRFESSATRSGGKPATTPSSCSPEIWTTATFSSPNARRRSFCHDVRRPRASFEACLNPFRVDVAVLVLDLDGHGAGAVGRPGDRRSELAMSDGRAHDERVAAPKRDAAVDDHLGVAAQLVGRHRASHSEPS